MDQNQNKAVSGCTPEGCMELGLLSPGGLVMSSQAQPNPLGTEMQLSFGHKGEVRHNPFPAAARPLSPIRIKSLPVAVSFLGSSCVCTKLFCRGTSPLLTSRCRAVTKARRAGQSVLKQKLKRAIQLTACAENQASALVELSISCYDINGDRGK